MDRLAKYYRDKKSGAFKFINPGSDGKRLYFEGRAEYKSVLIKLLLATADRLQPLGVNVKIVVGDDIKQEETKEAA